ncbi:hypothetical protein KDN34_10725 [Shewanella yunxiaonensis]|uniref:Uncharacterized protein n=1 Tax=Shewanella yunxiaonensis TaxID=2829809 RepID=A0ABX7YPU5_9GAMM|nr:MULTISPECIES: hypothetical protein [Shewanella]MDF0535072.1 hypothetical protein [Shewanella sp. A32]QUN04727.1 hypothetical protein KDN34_10725 [Shewanella yunxiaonensis]
MHRLETGIKRFMLVLGGLGVVVIYGGFFYLLFSGRSTAPINWYYLLSPWLCVFFGLSKEQQHRVLQWFLNKFKGKK